MLSYTGVNQTTPIGTPATATGNVDSSGLATATVNVTTVAGELVVACAWVHNPGFSTTFQLTPAGGSTGRYEVEGNVIGGYGALQVIELVASGTSTTMSVSVSDAQPTDGRWGIIAFVVRAPDPPPPPPAVFDIVNGTRRNRPGRGPRSLGHYYRPIGAMSAPPVYVPVAPVLSAATVVSVTATTAVPRVTVDF